VGKGGNPRDLAPTGVSVLGRILPDAGVIHHSDRSGQHTSLAFGQRYRRVGVVPSTGSTGDYFNNALAESLLATLECELVDGARTTRRALRSSTASRVSIAPIVGIQPSAISVQQSSRPGGA
jgi:transposase InsO family protein